MESRLIAWGYAMVPRADGERCEVGGVSQQVMDLFLSQTAALRPEVEKMAAAYERKYGHPPSKRTRWLMDQQAAAMTALSQVHRDVAAYERRPIAVIDDAMKEMAAPTAPMAGATHAGALASSLVTQTMGQPSSSANPKTAPSSLYRISPFSVMTSQ